MNTNTCPDPRCGGRVEPITNGNGGLVDRCTKCNRTPQGARTAIGIQRAQQTSTPAAPARAVAPIAGNPGRACPVKGCPGKLDAGGACASCAKRQAFLEANKIQRFCEICDGVLGKRALKFCEACGPIASKVNAAKKKQTVGAQ